MTPSDICFLEPTGVCPHPKSISWAIYWGSLGCPTRAQTGNHANHTIPFVALGMKCGPKCLGSFLRQFRPGVSNLLVHRGPNWQFLKRLQARLTISQLMEHRIKWERNFCYRIFEPDCVISEAHADRCQMLLSCSLWIADHCQTRWWHRQFKKYQQGFTGWTEMHGGPDILAHGLLCWIPLV